MGSDSMPLAPGVPFPPSLHFLAVHLMGRLRSHEPESRMSLQNIRRKSGKLRLSLLRQPRFLNGLRVERLKLSSLDAGVDWFRLRPLNYPQGLGLKRSSSKFLGQNGKLTDKIIAKATDSTLVR